MRDAGIKVDHVMLWLARACMEMNQVVPDELKDGFTLDIPERKPRMKIFFVTKSMIESVPANLKPGNLVFVDSINDHADDCMTKINPQCHCTCGLYSVKYQH